MEGLTTRPRLARKQNIASEVGPTLQDAFFFPTRSIREASARQHQARCSAQTGRCKLVCASCSGRLVPASGSLQVGLCKLRSLQVALCKLLCASCSVQVALRKLLCACCSRQGALRKLVGASWSAQVALCNLLCASCSAQVALKCKLHLATPAREPGRNRTRDPPVPGAGARTTRQLPKTSSNNRSRKNLEFLHLHHADSRTGSREHRRNRKKKPWVFAPSTTTIPAEGRASSAEIAKTMGFCTSTTPIPAEGRASRLEIAKNNEFLHLDHADPRRGSREHRRNRKKNHGFLHLDHADPRRGAQESQKNHGFLHLDHPIPAEGRASRLEIAKKPWVFAPRPRRSPHRVARAPQKSQKTMGFCTSTTPIPAEGRASSAETANNHGFLHLDHADPRRGSIFV